MTTPTPTYDIPVEVQLALIDQTINAWKETRYQAQLNYRVHKGVGSPDEVLAACLHDVKRSETALDLLMTERAALTGASDGTRRLDQ